jgi:uncharacterized protein
MDQENMIIPHIRTFPYLYITADLYNMETVLITGGSGLIGQRLTPMLLEKGYRVTHLSRRAGSKNGVTVYSWDVDKSYIDEEAVKTADYIIHLAGANIAEERWTSKRKKEIIDSRAVSAGLLYEQLHKHKKKLKAFVSSSAVGYYGMVTTDRIFNENDKPAKDFLGETCRIWEESAGPVAAMRIRTVWTRLGIVLSPDGGALKKMVCPVKYYIGSPLGSGRQYMPWVHIEDACRALIMAMENESMHGAYNIVAEQSVTNAELTRAIAKVLDKPLWAPAVPSFVLRLMFGEMASMILEGSRASNGKLLAAGFTFKFPRLEDALSDLLKK